MNSTMTLPEIVAQLKSCGFECDAGRLEFNAAFQALAELAGREAEEVSALTPSAEHIPARFLAVESRRYCPRCGVAFLNVEGDCPVCYYRFMAARYGRRMSELRGELEGAAVRYRREAEGESEKAGGCVLCGKTRGEHGEESDCAGIFQL